MPTYRTECLPFFPIAPPHGGAEECWTLHYLDIARCCARAIGHIPMRARSSTGLAAGWSDIITDSWSIRPADRPRGQRPVRLASSVPVVPRPLPGAEHQIKPSDKAQGREFITGRE